MKWTHLLPIALAACLTFAPAASARLTATTTGEHRFGIGSVHLWYRVAGKPGGTPVLFLHGGPGEGSQTFARYAGPALEARLRMVYLDQRGSGRSDRPKAADDYSIAQLVEDIEALRLRLGAPRIDLIGHSFGTILGLEYAARYPHHVAHLVLAGAVPDLPRMIDIQCTRLQASDPAAFARAMQGKTSDAYPRCDVFRAYDGDKMGAAVHRNMYPDPATGRKVDAMDSADGLGNTGELGKALGAKGLWSYRFADTGKVTAPTLIIAGGRDFQAVEAPQRDLAKALPRGRFLLYPNDGHFMFVEEPRRFAKDVTAFLGR
jgi:proline iminopeptidase